MAYHWLRTPKALILSSLTIVLLFSLACGGAAEPPAQQATTAPVVAKVTKAPVATAAPVATKAPVVTAAADPKESRLVLVIDKPTKLSPLFWLTTTSASVQHRPMTEALILVDRFTGEFNPGLATEWQLSADGKKMTLKLREGVPFHFGLGEFDAKDLEHSRFLMTQEESIHSDQGYFTKLHDSFNVISDQEVEWNLTRPEAVFTRRISEFRAFSMWSKDQWDTDGRDGMEKRPAGTGAYQFVQYDEGVRYLYERVPYDHWRVRADFPELEIRFVKEPATRLAQLLAGESHIAELPKSILPSARDRGMKIIPSAIPALETYLVFGGQYPPDWPEFDATVPWAAPGETGRKVRLAMNLAVNNKEIQEAIFAGSGEYKMMTHYNPVLNGWNPEWVERFDELYGYDPERAKTLLAEAGYPNGFEVPMWVFTMGQVPEMPEFTEAVAKMWQKIGLKPKLIDIEFGQVRTNYRGKKTVGFVFPFRILVRPAAITHFFQTNPDRFLREYTSPSITDRYGQLEQTIDPDKRDVLLREMGNELFEQVSHVPIVQVPLEVAINPDVVAEYTFFGPVWGNYVNLEYAKGVR